MTPRTIVQHQDTGTMTRAEGELVDRPASHPADEGPRIEIFSWNGVQRMFTRRILRRVPISRPVNNFGDLLGPRIVRWAASQHGTDADGRARSSVRLLSVGSVMHEARTNDVVWGAGVNGMVRWRAHVFENLDVRAVRGPLTKMYLESRGIQVPNVFGDPALLLPLAMPWLREIAEKKRHDITIVPNFAEMPMYRGQQDVLDPRSPVEECLRRIAQSRFVVGSSLHGVIVAEALGVSARAMRCHFDPPFKYLDYFAGTGRSNVQIAENVEHAMSLGPNPPLDWSSEPLLRAFPRDLWIPGN